MSQLLGTDLLGIPQSQAARLLREDPWNNANDLAQELFAILTARVPSQLNGPVQVDNPSGDPNVPLFQIPVQNGQTIFQFTRQGQQIGGITWNDGTGLGGSLSPDEDQATGGTPALPGTVLSGSGSSYQVQLSTGQTVAAVPWPQPSDNIDPGTQGWVFQVGTTNYLQVAVWQ